MLGVPSAVVLIAFMLGGVLGFYLAQLRYGATFEELRRFANRVQITLQEERDCRKALEELLRADLPKRDRPTFDAIELPSAVLRRARTGNGGQ